ncbi:MAG: CoA-binding protein, partial [Deltaproteobacteria bacterium]|nr:CoA-binding protein [Deltaproteobacteria bacterium]
MSINNLDKIFEPNSIAIVGASEREGSVGYALVNNIRNGYKGKIIPINPKRKTILGYKAYPSIAEVPDPVDLVVIATPITTAPQYIAECAQKGVGGAIVISAGGKEVGEKGKAIEKQILKKAHEGNVRIIGPNCAGIFSARSDLNANFASRTSPLTGNLAFVSQSGAICSSIHDY